MGEMEEDRREFGQGRFLEILRRSALGLVAVYNLLPPEVVATKTVCALWYTPIRTDALIQGRYPEGPPYYSWNSSKIACFSSTIKESSPTSVNLRLPSKGTEIASRLHKFNI